MHDSDFDDHEPGDVNGNVDPAFARKAQRAPRERTPRNKRRPREGSAAPTAKVAGAAMLTRGGDEEGNAAPNAPVAAVADVDAGTPQRPRGARRNRRGGRNRAQRDTAGNDRPVVGASETQEHTSIDGAPSMPDEAYAGDQGGRSEPNPGAFGDPSRPMDRSARRNRSRRDKRRAARGPTEAAVGTDGVASDEARSAPREGGERLHKVLAQQGLGSRRDMEALIDAGEVEVNGVRAHVGQVVNEKDRVHVKRRKVTVKLGDDKPRILMYHKPAGEIVSRDDPEQRDTVFDHLPKPDHGKWIAIGRLDYNSEGLLLFTTYGELANRLMHPRYEVLREYSVRVLGELSHEQEDQLIDGIELEDGPARVLSLDRIDRDSDAANHWYRLTLNEGRNREVRRMFEHLGLTVSRLIRTRYGSVQMPSWLKRGQHKLLDELETFNVLEAVGLRSKKKLEKAARFGGRNKMPQQPLGPMRSATEHEALWQGAVPEAMHGGRRPHAEGGARKRGRAGAATSAVSLTQQQFPGFGGASEMQAATRRPRVPGNKIKPGKRPRGGDVNGNVAPKGNASGKPAGRRGSRRRSRSGAPRAGVPTVPDVD
ncbi:MAG: rRNA pseudouridine synthase [Burkholderiales bacterium]|nr:rRNA pseudouridine synthase [Burkholderiales bacterium]